MQYLKSEIDQLITDAAVNEFYHNGYENTSMRTIALKAGISVGNLYRYYSCKEKLFEHIIMHVYEKTVYLIEHHNDFRIELNMENLAQIIEVQGKIISETLSENRKALLILIDGSRGTKFEKIKRDLVAVMTDHVSEHFHKYYENKKGIDRLALSKILSVGYLESLWDILRDNDDKENIRKLFIEYIKIMVFGMSILF